MTSLASTQRLFFHALLEPLSGRSRASTDLPPSDIRLSDRFRHTARHLLKESSNLSSVERLELYHRQYWFRLLESIEEDFPWLQGFLGAERFWTLIEDYLLAHPSTRFTLRGLGSKLPAFAATWGGLSAEEAPWATGIASMEWAMMDVYDSPNRGIPRPEDFLSHPIGLQDHVRLLPLPVPAHLLCTQNPPGTGELASEPALVVVWRPNARGPRWIAEDLTAHPLLMALQGGGKLEDLLASLDEPPPSETLTDWFRLWHEHGWFAQRDAIPNTLPSITIFNHLT